jgi:hypothetical protein
MFDQKGRCMVLTNQENRFFSHLVMKIIGQCQVKHIMITDKNNNISFEADVNICHHLYMAHPSILAIISVYRVKRV